jgi:hypothetical protein
MGTVVFFTGTKRKECEPHYLQPVRKQVKKQWFCTSAYSTKFFRGVARHKLYFYNRIYIDCTYSSRWYRCKIRLHYKLPTTDAFHKIPYSLSPTSLFRTLKFLAVYSTHLLKVNLFCSMLVHRLQKSAQRAMLILSRRLAVYCLEDTKYKIKFP